MDDTRAVIKQYILEEFLPGENPDNLNPTTRLLSSRILDSLATLKLVAFLEDQFGVTIEAYETSEDYMDTIEEMEKLVQSKRSPASIA